MDESPVTIYLCADRRPIAIAKTITLVAKAYFPKDSKQKVAARIKYAIANKTRMTVHTGEIIAVRYSNAEQIVILGKEDIVFLE